MSGALANAVARGRACCSTSDAAPPIQANANAAQEVVTIRFMHAPGRQVYVHLPRIGGPTCHVGGRWHAVRRARHACFIDEAKRWAHMSCRRAAGAEGG